MLPSVGLMSHLPLAWKRNGGIFGSLGLSPVVSPRFLILPLFQSTVLTFAAQSTALSAALQGTAFSEHLISACPANKSSTLFLHMWEIIQNKLQEVPEH